MKNADMPAMPVTFDRYDEVFGQIPSGFTKREELAAKAMQGLLAGSHRPSSGLAETSVKLADTLLAELEKEPNQ